MAQGVNNPENKGERNDTPLKIMITKELDTLLDAIVMADTHETKTNIVRKALSYYIESVIPPSVRENAKKIVILRKKTLEAVGREV